MRLSPSTTQTLRIPVQFFVPVQDPDPADEPAGVGLEGPIWAETTTDYSAIGFEDPTADIFTDWTTLPLRLACGTTRVDLAVYDVEGADHMDVFVFADNGQEVDSTVTPFLHHAVPGGALYALTTQDRPARVSIRDGDDRQELSLPLRFAYTSDPATNLENFYVDDVRILDAAGNVLFADDMETPGNWVPGGNPGFQWVTASG